MLIRNVCLFSVHSSQEDVKDFIRDLCYIGGKFTLVQIYLTSDKFVINFKLPHFFAYNPFLGSRGNSFRPIVYLYYLLLLEPSYGKSSLLSV